MIYDSDGRTYRDNSSTEGSSNIHVWSLDSWWKKLLLILVVVAVIVVIFAVISGIVSLIAPVLIPLLVIILLVRMLKKAMVIKKAGGIRFFCNGKKLMSPAFLVICSIC